MDNADTPLLEVRRLVKYFPIRKGFARGRTVANVHAVDDVTFHVSRGETLGLVGESGCGKSTTARTVVRLLEATSGAVLFEGEDFLALRGESLRQKRRRIQMIFQDPYASLNPRMKVGAILREPLQEHGLDGDGARVEDKVGAMMEMVGLSPDFIDRYPHEFSGGQRQRIGIARALMLEPSLIICDEPISALDVSVQAQIVNLLEDLQRKLNLAYLFVAHDLSMMRHISRRVAVMYLGGIVETGPKERVYSHPAHPYTQALLSAVPTPNPKTESMRKRILLMGDIPSPINPPSGCRFHTRCRHAADVCHGERPAMRQLVPGHFVACHLAEELGRERHETPNTFEACPL